MEIRKARERGDERESRGESKCEGPIGAGHGVRAGVMGARG